VAIFEKKKKTKEKDKKTGNVISHWHLLAAGIPRMRTPAQHMSRMNTC